ncbi:LPXTG cell wall anchor domain-containing protein, partial [Anoxybacillus geothermalis]|nr:LPXTG cell wall anchor domain-containing protein [Anoxybacillus geothermalis]
IDAGLLAVEMKGKLDGEKRPETASPYLTYTLAGLMLASAGFLLYRRVRRLKG